MKKIIYILIFFAFFGCSCKSIKNSSTRPNSAPMGKIFSYDASNRCFGIAKDNVVEFYTLDDDGKWHIDYVFDIPPDCKDIFSFGSGDLGVITDAKIKFYRNSIVTDFDNWIMNLRDDEENNPWYEEPLLEFDLPQNFQTAFGTMFYVGIVAGNNVNMYSHDWSNHTWVMVHDTDFALPQNWENVFGFGLDASFCFVADKKIKFCWYSSHFNNWLEDTKMGFDLPANYNDVFANNQGQYVIRRQEGDDNDWIGVSIGDKIKFYSYTINGWIEMEYAEFCK